MVKMFRSLNKKDKINKDYAPLTNSTASIIIEPICKHEGNTNNCDLVEKLKEKQRQRRIILNELSVEDSRGHTIQKFAHLLKCMEDEGFEMSNWEYSRVKWLFQFNHAIKRIERALNKIELEDIDDIAAELKALKGLEGKRKQLETIDKEILLIKASLGIE
jgi:hypothetical protein